MTERQHLFAGCGPEHRQNAQRLAVGFDTFVGDATTRSDCAVGGKSQQILVGFYHLADRPGRNPKLLTAAPDPVRGGPDQTGKLNILELAQFAVVPPGLPHKLPVDGRHATDAELVGRLECSGHAGLNWHPKTTTRSARSAGRSRRT